MKTPLRSYPDVSCRENPTEEHVTSSVMELMAKEKFDRLSLKWEILIHLSDFPEKIVKAKNPEMAYLAITLGNCLRSIAHLIEDRQGDLFRPNIEDTATSVSILAAQLRQAGLETWDCGKIQDPVSARLDGVTLALEALTREVRGGKGGHR